MAGNGGPDEATAGSSSAEGVGGVGITGCANNSCAPPYIELAVVSALGRVGASGSVGASGRPKLDS